ncbi:uncharacterized protein PV09_09849 [Verruconis gallopava]|uniref:Uncharacterized protein n=1 Tax=Verruconis gallopava TaxID=253628 RepID=A0A0D2AH87_9PEZI|nr:uncharacterized protein PV09_09849 [Verruconis gallopava]KIV98303.1 hypothetical protein PV09_09849 [Verruconis gallopava]
MLPPRPAVVGRGKRSAKTQMLAKVMRSWDALSASEQHRERQHLKRIFQTGQSVEAIFILNPGLLLLLAPYLTINELHLIASFDVQQIVHLLTAQRWAEAESFATLASEIYFYVRDYPRSKLLIDEREKVDKVVKLEFSRALHIIRSLRYANVYIGIAPGYPLAITIRAQETAEFKAVLEQGEAAQRPQGRIESTGSVYTFSLPYLQRIIHRSFSYRDFVMVNVTKGLFHLTVEIIDLEMAVEIFKDGDLKPLKRVGPADDVNPTS